MCRTWCVALQKRLKMFPTHQVKHEDACDTSFSKGSLQAALRACGIVCETVDRVINHGYNNAFCVVRPPGHHAGVSGLLVDSDPKSSCGFCIFNSVAIAALHALERHRAVRWARQALCGSSTRIVASRGGGWGVGNRPVAAVAAF